MTMLDTASLCLNIIVDIVFLFSFSFVITGVSIGILQTIFSVQDQSLPIVAKLLVLIFLISNKGGEIFEQFNTLFYHI